MKAAALNRMLNAARNRSERDELAGIIDVYRTAIRQAAREASRRFSAITAAADWQPPPEGFLLPVDALAAIAVQQLRDRFARVIEHVAAEPLARIGIAWDITHPLAAALLEKASLRTGVQLGDAVQPVIREAVARAYEEGLTVPETAAAIRQAVSEAAEWQAEMLARTDLNSLANGASQAAARLAGAPYKIWLATLDDRTRPEHADAHDQTVPIDQPFLVGGELADYPGAPELSTAMAANCRCTLAYSDEPALAEPPPTLTAGGTSMATLTQTKWISDLAFEGDATSDGRFMLPRSLKPRELPLTLMAMTVTDDGHDGAFVAGRIDSIRRSSVDIDGEKLPDGVVTMRGAGIFDMAGDGGADVARLVADEILRGVSVDLGILAWCFRDPDTGELIEPSDATDEQMERAFFGELQFAVKEAEILAATVCPTPAFARAKIALTSSADHVRVIRVWSPLRVDESGAARDAVAGTGALLAAAQPARPPRDWFLTTEPPGKMPLTITPEGRVFGHLACWDTCHTGLANVCTTPPRSTSGYAYFHVGEIETAEGDMVAVGKLMLAGKHAPLNLTRGQAARHYDDNTRVAAYLRASDGRYGIWVAGSVVPRLSADRMVELRANPPSGDWREVNGGLELIAALCVPVPGFPVPRAEAALVAAGDEIGLSALVASSGAIAPEEAVVRALGRAGLLPDGDAAAARAELAAARADGIDGLVKLAEGVNA